MIPYGNGERKGKSRKAAHTPWPLLSDGSETPAPSQTGEFGPFRPPKVVGVGPDMATAHRSQWARHFAQERRSKRLARTLLPEQRKLYKSLGLT